MRFFALLTLIFLGAFTGTALAAQAAAPDGGSLLDLTRPLFDAVVHGQWWAAAAAAVVMSCALARKYMPASWTSGIKGDIVGTATAFVMAFAAAIGTWAIAPGAVMTFAVITTALKVGVAAIGGYNILHKLATWAVASGKLPAWALPIVSLLASMIGSNAVAKAQAAGDKAVAADPPKGMAGGDKVIEVE